MNPTISVIIPVYNVESYLPRCLNSVVCNTYRELEIICINDGSTDGSLRILDEYAGKDGRIHVYTQSNKGVVAARNLGLDKAHGEWISFVDADDWLHPQYFELLIGAWKLKGCNADIVCCHCDITDKYSENFLHYTISDDMVSQFSWPDVTRDLFRSSTLWMRIYKRALVGDFRLPASLVSAEDTATNMMLMGRTSSLNGLQISPQLYHYYQRDTSAAHTLNVVKKLPSLKYVINEVDQFPSTIAKHQISELLLYYLAILLLYRDAYSKAIYAEARALYRQTLALWKTTRVHSFSQFPTYIKFEIWYCFPSFHLWYCKLRSPQLKESIRSEASKQV